MNTKERLELIANRVRSGLGINCNDGLFLLELLEKKYPDLKSLEALEKQDESNAMASKVLETAPFLSRLMFSSHDYVLVDPNANNAIVQCRKCKFTLDVANFSDVMVAPKWCRK